MAAAIDEEAIIRKRYLTQTVSTAANALPPFKKLVKRYMQFCQALEGGGTVEEAERLHAELLADLYAIRFHMEKLQAQSAAFKAEQRLYAERQAQLQASIQQAERDIEDRKRELGEARVELAHKQEYEAVRRQVMEVPARSTSLAEQEATLREIGDLQQQGAGLDALFEQRRAQFAGVLASLEALQRCIDKEEPEEGAAAPNGGAAAAPQQRQQPMQVG